MRAILFAALLPLAACGNSGETETVTAGVPASGSGNARTWQVADFTEVSLRGPDDVDVRVGAGFSVRAEGDSDALDRLVVERVGSALRIGRKRQTGISWGGGDGVKVYVTMPRITAAELAGSGDLAVDRAETATFTGDLAGAGNLSVGTLAAQSTSFSIAGSGNVTAAGTTRALRIDIAGSGNVEAGGLTASSADVSIAGSGDIKARVDGDARVSIMGSGDVDLGPGARCRTSKMGSGSIRCGG